jgi:hypothetical protein
VTESAGRSDLRLAGLLCGLVGLYDIAFAVTTITGMTMVGYRIEVPFADFFGFSGSDGDRLRREPADDRAELGDCSRYPASPVHPAVRSHRLAAADSAVPKRASMSAVAETTQPILSTGGFACCKR